MMMMMMMMMMDVDDDDGDDDDDDFSTVRHHASPLSFSHLLTKYINGYRDIKCSTVDDKDK